MTDSTHAPAGGHSSPVSSSTHPVPQLRNRKG